MNHFGCALFLSRHRPQTMKTASGKEHAMATSGRNRSYHVLEALRRAFTQFLTIPSVVILAFLVLAAATYFLDRLRIANDWPALFPATHESARSLLGTIAGGIITVTSITFSLLLVAVQQGAAALTSQVYDQFLRRRANQLYFGFFIGLALYCLVILATIHREYTPNYGVALAFALTVVALYILILLIYTTIDQSRPVMVIAAIRDLALVARELQLPLLRQTRETGRLTQYDAIGIDAQDSGFLTRIDAVCIEKEVAKIGGKAEIAIFKSIGDYVAFGDTLAEIRVRGVETSQKFEEAIRSALFLETQRDLETDPAYGIEQLETIGWTSISTAKSNPQPGLLACWMLRDLMARWYDGDSGEGDADDTLQSVVIYRDSLSEALMNAFESLAVIASESMQHQTIAEIYKCFAERFASLPSTLQLRAEDLLLRSLSALGDHVPTRRLDEALTTLAWALAEAGSTDAAQAVRAAHEKLAANVGRFRARSTRAG
jgi:uncharacterized membrane protein